VLVISSNSTFELPLTYVISKYYCPTKLFFVLLRKFVKTNKQKINLKLAEKVKKVWSEVRRSLNILGK
jgi:hypothetical protein